MSHREYRQTVHAICNDFYSQIKGLDGTEQSWERIHALARAYCRKCGDTPLCKALILAVMDEFERDIESEGNRWTLQQGSGQRESRSGAQKKAELSVR